MSATRTLPLIFAIIGFFAGVAYGTERPNIVLIMADDLGFSDIGCYGSEIQTPNLDRLARNGLRFSQFYNTAKCHSSRVSLLTGLYCGQAGNESMRHGLTLAEAVRPAGYETIMVGKWHLKNEPTDRGFTRYFGHLSGATNFFTGDNSFRLNGQPWNDFDEDFYTTDANTDYAIRFLDEVASTKKPFFLYMAYNAPHYPLQAPEADVMRYRGKYKQGWDQLRQERHQRQINDGLLPAKWKLSQRPQFVPDWESLSDEEKDWEDFRMATYAAMVDRLDQNIGRLIEHLKKMGVFENTLIMFCSDNGACPFARTRGKGKKPWDPESYWTYDSGWAHAGNTPFRWFKQNQHEGGISGPMIAHWPNGLKTTAGSINREPTHLIDFMPTLVELADAKYPSTFDGRTITPTEGQSIAGVFLGEPKAERDFLYFHFSNNRAIRRENWKLVSARGGPWELFDLDADRTETTDLATSHPEKVKELADAWHKFAKENDQLDQKKRKPVGKTMRPVKPGTLRAKTKKKS